MRWRNENGVLKPILFSAEDPFELSCCHWLLQSLKFGGEELYGDLFVLHNLDIWWRHGRCSLPAWTRFHPHQRPSDPSHQRGNMWYSSCTFKCSFSAQPYSGSLELGPPSKFLLSPSSLCSLPEAIMTVASGLCPAPQWWTYCPGRCSQLPWWFSGRRQPRRSRPAWWRWILFSEVKSTFIKVQLAFILAFSRGGGRGID